jgi:Subtilase family/FG-GAP-like repeat
MLSQGRVGVSALSGATAGNGFFVVPENNWNASDTGFLLVGNVPFAALVAPSDAALSLDQVKPGKVRLRGQEIEILADNDTRIPKSDRAPVSDTVYVIGIMNGVPLRVPVDYLTRPLPSMAELLKVDPKVLEPKINYTDILKEQADKSRNVLKENPIGQQEFTTRVINNAKFILNNPGFVRPNEKVSEVLDAQGKVLYTKDQVIKRLQMEAENVLRAPESYGIGLSFAPQETVVAIADFDGDQKNDYLYRNQLTGELTIWYMNGTVKTGEVPLVPTSNTAPGYVTAPGSDWKVAGVADMNGDGYVDIIWRNDITSTVVYWYLQQQILLGVTFDSGAVVNPFVAPGVSLSTATVPFTIESVADMNGDGKADIVWRNYTSGANVVHFMNNTSYLGGATMPNAPVNQPTDNWDMVGTGKFDNDNTPDVVWHNRANGAVVVWALQPTYNGTQITNFNINSANSGVVTYNGSAVNVPSSVFTGSAVGALDADGKGDIIWDFGNLVHWRMGGTNNLTVLPAPSSGFGIDNYTSATKGDYIAGTNFHSGFGYGLLDVAAAIKVLNGQTLLERSDASGMNVAFNSSRQNEMINAPEVWATGNEGQGIIVAVIDRGISLSHPDLDDNLWVNPGEIPGNGIDDDANGVVDDVNGAYYYRVVDQVTGVISVKSSNSLTDFNSHGTSVTGMIAAEKINNGGFTITGVAPRSKIMVLKDGDFAPDPLATAASINYAVAKGAKIINISSDFGNSLPASLTNAINNANNAGAIIVVGAGDYSNSNFPQTIANGSLAALSRNATTPNVISVGAVSAGALANSQTIANNVNRLGASYLAGNTVGRFLVAPGYEVSTTAAPNTYAGSAGTSYSAPMVSGAIALIKQAVPNASMTQIVNALMQSADSSGVTV